MKNTNKNFKQIFFSVHIFALCLVALMSVLPHNVSGQRIANVLDQNITFYAENEELEDVIKQICDQSGLDYKYNSKLIRGKRVSLNVINKSVKEVLDSLMNDYFLIFNIDKNLLVVRDYVPMWDHIDFEKLYNTPSSGFLFENERRKWEKIKFSQISNLIIIPIRINGSDTMNFILDTGVRDPIITELTLVEKLNLNYMKSIDLRGLGNETTTQAYQSGNNTLTIPGLKVEGQKINVVLDESFQISQILGMPVHGIIGFNLFRHYIMEVDYKHEEIKLIKPQHYKYRPRRNDIVLPISFVHNKPIIKSEIVQDSGDVIPVNLLVDTGASDALWLSTLTTPKINIPQKNIYAYLGSGINGDLFGYKGRINALWIGGVPVSKPIASFPEAEYIHNIINSEMRHGSIGGELLRRFTVTFDYYNHRIILRPNSSINEKFQYNMSGLEIINPVPGLNVYTISNVIENSPAWNAGLQKNDQIISINFSNHNNITLNDINLMLKTRKNKKIRIKVLRNGEIIKTSFYLNELL